MNQNLNLETIARLAGVSRSTVSRVINNHPNVSETTRKKVMRVIREQNYHPNLAARALVTRQTRVLSLVIPQAIAATFTDPYFPILVQSVIAEASRRDYAVMLCVGDQVEEEERFCERILNNSLVDGVVVASAIHNDPLVPRLAHAGFPFVVIGCPPIDNANYIDTDNVRGTQVAVSHLVRLGRRRIGTVTGPMNMSAGRDRLQGYRQALEHAGFAVKPALIVEGNFDEASGYLGMKRLLQHPIDAVFAASDVMALGALRAIHEAGLRVPEDISVVGFDDLPFAASTTPALTTVRQSVEGLGTLATRTLIDLLNDDLDEPFQMVLPVELVIRESCGAIRPRK